MEEVISLNLNQKANEITDKKNDKTPDLIDTPRKNSTNSDVEAVPEIQDIYDHIYGNVKNKLVFYENKKKRTISDEWRVQSREMTPTPINDGKSFSRTNSNSTTASDDIKKSESTKPKSEEWSTELTPPSENARKFTFVTKSKSRTNSNSTTASDDAKNSEISNPKPKVSLNGDSKPANEFRDVTPIPSSDEVKSFSVVTNSNSRPNSGPTASDEPKNAELAKQNSKVTPNLQLDLSRAHNNSGLHSNELSPTLDDVRKFSNELTNALNESNLNNNNGKYNDTNSDADSSSSSSTNLHLKKSSSTEKCIKCEKHGFVLDRTEILTEINANLKSDFEKIKKELKKEITKNNTLNFEIANIESTFETYYKEASQQKSSFATIYSVMKSYVVDETSGESYTFQRIKAISNYIESLKNKFVHQDRIIKNNFIENPYYSDLMIKHDAVIKQLDVLSLENKHLVEEKKKKELDELDAIKELNRQKFQLEKKYQEMEEFYKGKIAECELKIKQMQDEQKKQVKDFDNSLAHKDEEIAKIEQTFAAKISNYEQELLMIYGKFNKAKVENQM